MGVVRISCYDAVMESQGGVTQFDESEQKLLGVEPSVPQELGTIEEIIRGAQQRREDLGAKAGQTRGPWAGELRRPYLEEMAALDKAIKGLCDQIPGLPDGAADAFLRSQTPDLD